MIHEATGAKVLSLHQDISTVTGEEIIVFTLARAFPTFERQKRDRLCESGEARPFSAAAPSLIQVIGRSNT